MNFVHFWKTNLKSKVLLFLPLALLSTLQGCSDYFAYNYSSPQRITVIPKQKLEAEAKESYLNKDAISISQRFADKSWGSQFVETASHLYGWRPDFCNLLQTRNYPGIELDKFLGNKVATDRLKRVFWESYLSHVYFDVMLDTPTTDDPRNTHIKDAIDAIIQGHSNVKVPGDSRGLVTGPLETEEGNFAKSLLTLKEKIPICSSSQVENDKPRELSQSFLTRFLRLVDNDHSQLLIDAGQLEKAKPRIENWVNSRESNKKRDMTVSKVSPASISPSIERSTSTEVKEKPIFLDLTDKGQKAVVDYLSSLVEKCPIEPPSTKDTKESGCEKKAFESLKKLLGQLNPKEESLRLQNFESTQSFELVLSSVLNSPDVANRLDYVSTYLLFFAYPYPANGSVRLEEEFWRNVMVFQRPRRPEDRSQYFESDLENAWNKLRVKIEKVDTTVQYAPLEIAKVTREGTQGIVIKPEPSIDLKGTVKGKIETPLSISSSLKTTVEEKLLKELDRRSTWLSPERNILRLTQRGVESINISGGLKERVTIQVPASKTQVFFLDFVENEVAVKSVGQPVYKKVTALSVSIGVVREPYDFHRSATEKYGLPDGADAYYVVVVSSPVALQVWDWSRTIDRLDIMDIDLKAKPRLKDPDEIPLWFFSPRLNLEAPAYLATKSADDLRVALREGLNRVLGKKPSDKEKWAVKCVNTKLMSQPTEKDGLYLILGKSEDLAEENPNKLMNIWIGKQEVTVESQRDILASDEKYVFSKLHIVPFEGTENDTLALLLKGGFCKGSI